MRFPAEKLKFRRPVNLRNKQYYGRQIPEIQPEEILTETLKGRERQPEKERGRCGKIRRQEEVTVRFLLFLPSQKGGTDFLETFRLASIGVRLVSSCP